MSNNTLILTNGDTPNNLLCFLSKTIVQTVNAGQNKIYIFDSTSSTPLNHILKHSVGASSDTFIAMDYNVDNNSVVALLKTGDKYIWHTINIASSSVDASAKVTLNATPENIVACGFMIGIQTKLNNQNYLSAFNAINYEALFEPVAIGPSGKPFVGMDCNYDGSIVTLVGNESGYTFDIVNSEGHLSDNTAPFTSATFVNSDTPESISYCSESVIIQTRDTTGRIYLYGFTTTGEIDYDFTSTISGSNKDGVLILPLSDLTASPAQSLDPKGEIIVNVVCCNTGLSYILRDPVTNDYRLIFIDPFLLSIVNPPEILFRNNDIPTEIICCGKLLGIKAYNTDLKCYFGYIIDIDDTESTSSFGREFLEVTSSGSSSAIIDMHCSEPGSFVVLGANSLEFVDTETSVTAVTFSNDTPQSVMTCGQSTVVQAHRNSGETVLYVYEYGDLVKAVVVGNSDDTFIEMSCAPILYGNIILVLLKTNNQYSLVSLNLSGDLAPLTCDDFLVLTFLRTFAGGQLSDLIAIASLLLGTPETTSSGSEGGFGCLTCGAVIERLLMIFTKVSLDNLVGALAALGYSFAGIAEAIDSISPPFNGIYGAGQDLLNALAAAFKTNAICSDTEIANALFSLTDAIMTGNEQSDLEIIAEALASAGLSCGDIAKALYGIDGIATEGQTLVREIAKALWTSGGCSDTTNDNETVITIAAALQGIYGLDPEERAFTDNEIADALIGIDDSVTQDMVIAGLDLPVVTISGAGDRDSVCAGTLLTASATGGAGGYTYLWQDESTTNTFTVSSAATYSVVAIDSKGVSSFLASVTITTVNALPTVTIAGESNVCIGGAIILTVTVNLGEGYYYDYQWYDGNNDPISGATNATYSPPTTTAGIFTYTVTATDYNDCISEKSDPFTVTVNALPTVSIAANGATTICSGGTFPTLTATPSNAVGSSTYEWKFNGSSISGATSTTYSAGSNTIGGSYAVTMSDSSGCSSVTSSDITVTVNALPIITTQSLPNATVGTAYTTTLAVSGGSSPYIWTVSSGTLPAGLSLEENTDIISGRPTTAASAVSLNITVTDYNDCSSSATFDITVIEAQVPGNGVQIGSTSNPIKVPLNSGDTNPVINSCGARDPLFVITTDNKHLYLANSSGVIHGFNGIPYTAWACQKSNTSIIALLTPGDNNSQNLNFISSSGFSTSGASVTFDQNTTVWDMIYCPAATLNSNTADVGIITVNNNSYKSYYFNSKAQTPSWASADITGAPIKLNCGSIVVLSTSEGSYNVTVADNGVINDPITFNAAFINDTPQDILHCNNLHLLQTTDGSDQNYLYAFDTNGDQYGSTLTIGEPGDTYVDMVCCGTTAMVLLANAGVYNVIPVDLNNVFAYQSPPYDMSCLSMFDVFSGCQQDDFNKLALLMTGSLESSDATDVASELIAACSGVTLSEVITALSIASTENSINWSATEVASAMNTIFGGVQPFWNDLATALKIQDNFTCTEVGVAIWSLTPNFANVATALKEAGCTCAEIAIALYAASPAATITDLVTALTNIQCSPQDLGMALASIPGNPFGSNQELQDAATLVGKAILINELLGTPLNCMTMQAALDIISPLSNALANDISNGLCSNGYLESDVIQNALTQFSSDLTTFGFSEGASLKVILIEGLRTLNIFSPSEIMQILLVVNPNITLPNLAALLSDAGFSCSEIAIGAANLQGDPYGIGQTFLDHLAQALQPVCTAPQIAEALWDLRDFTTEFSPTNSLQDDLNEIAYALEHDSTTTANLTCAQIADALHQLGTDHSLSSGAILAYEIAEALWNSGCLGSTVDETDLNEMAQALLPLGFSCADIAEALYLVGVAHLDLNTVVLVSNIILALQSIDCNCAQITEALSNVFDIGAGGAVCCDSRLYTIVKNSETQLFNIVGTTLSFGSGCHQYVSSFCCDTALFVLLKESNGYLLYTFDTTQSPITQQFMGFKNILCGDNLAFVNSALTTGVDANYIIVLDSNYMPINCIQNYASSQAVELIVSCGSRCLSDQNQNNIIVINSDITSQLWLYVFNYTGSANPGFGMRLGSANDQVVVVKCCGTGLGVFSVLLQNRLTGLFTFLTFDANGQVVENPTCGDDCFPVKEDFVTSTDYYQFLSGAKCSDDTTSPDGTYIVSCDLNGDCIDETIVIHRDDIGQHYVTVVGMDSPCNLRIGNPGDYFRGAFCCDLNHDGINEVIIAISNPAGQLQFSTLQGSGKMTRLCPYKVMECEDFGTVVLLNHANELVYFVLNAGETDRDPFTLPFCPRSLACLELCTHVKNMFCCMKEDKTLVLVLNDEKADMLCFINIETGTVLLVDTLEHYINSFCCGGLIYIVDHKHNLKVYKPNGDTVSLSITEKEWLEIEQHSEEDKKLVVIYTMPDINEQPNFIILNHDGSLAKCPKCPILGDYKKTLKCKDSIIIVSQVPTQPLTLTVYDTKNDIFTQICEVFSVMFGCTLIDVWCACDQVLALFDTTHSFHHNSTPFLTVLYNPETGEVISSYQTKLMDCSMDTPADPVDMRNPCCERRERPGRRSRHHVINNHINDTVYYYEGDDAYYFFAVAGDGSLLFCPVKTDSTANEITYMFCQENKIVVVFKTQSHQNRLYIIDTKGHLVVDGIVIGNDRRSRNLIARWLYQR